MLVPGTKPVTIQDFEDAGYWYRVRGIGQYPTLDSHTPEQETAFHRGWKKADRELEIKRQQKDDFDE